MGRHAKDIKDVEFDPDGNEITKYSEHELHPRRLRRVMRLLIGGVLAGSTTSGDNVQSVVDLVYDHDIQRIQTRKWRRAAKGEKRYSPSWHKKTKPRKVA